jgi:hypothetical protein
LSILRSRPTHTNPKKTRQVFCCLVCMCVCCFPPLPPLCFCVLCSYSKKRTARIGGFPPPLLCPAVLLRRIRCLYLLSTRPPAGEGFRFVSKAKRRRSQQLSHKGRPLMLLPSLSFYPHLTGSHAHNHHPQAAAAEQRPKKKEDARARGFKTTVAAASIDANSHLSVHRSRDKVTGPPPCAALPP